MLQQRCCSNPWSNARNGSVLSSERNWYAKTWTYSSKSGKKLSAQINQWKVLPILRKWQLCARKLERIWRVYHQLCSGKKLFSLFWEHGHVFLPRNNTIMQNWQLPHIWKSKENWLFQCRWILRSLQKCLKLRDAITTTVLARKLVHQWAMKILRGNKKRVIYYLRREYNCEKGYKIEEIWEYEWWQNFKTNKKIRIHIPSNFLYKRPFCTECLLEKIGDGSLQAIFSVT